MLSKDSGYVWATVSSVTSFILLGEGCRAQRHVSYWHDVKCIGWHNEAAQGVLTLSHLWYGLSHNGLRCPQSVTTSNHPLLCSTTHRQMTLLHHYWTQHSPIYVDWQSRKHPGSACLFSLHAKVTDECWQAYHLHVYGESGLECWQAYHLHVYWKSGLGSSCFTNQSISPASMVRVLYNYYTIFECRI